MAKPTNAWQMVVLRVQYDPNEAHEPVEWDWPGLLGTEVMTIGAGDVCLPEEAHGYRDLLVKQGELRTMSDEDYDTYRLRRNDALERYDKNVAEYLDRAEREGVQKAGTFPGFPYVYMKANGTTVHLTENPVKKEESDE